MATLGTEALQPGTVDSGPRALLRSFTIALTAFLTLVDLFATQAILPRLAETYRVTPAAMSFAVNASTMGMAIAGLWVALLGRHVERRFGILLSLALLAIPTALLAVAPSLGMFTVLRIVQGLLMSTAFALTLSYLAERCSLSDSAGAFAAYITGNVASNLFGRIFAAALVDHLGLAANFYVFAALNVSGAVLVYFTLARTQPAPVIGDSRSAAWSAWTTHLRDPRLGATFAIGFLILFAFIGTFTFVNFVLARPPLALSQMARGFVYLVFVPSIFTTPIAGRMVQRFGARGTFWAAIAVAGAGLPLLVLANLAAVLAGLALVAVGTFFAQATATGFVGRVATTERAAASGIYLASYFFGGLVGTAVLGQLFDRLGWVACVTGIAVALALAAWLATRWKDEQHAG
jgi:predicted MFS family arabinose efflux permease